MKTSARNRFTGTDKGLAVGKSAHVLIKASSFVVAG